jgi:hypothetical protein
VANQHHDVLCFIYSGDGQHGVALAGERGRSKRFTSEC